MFHVKHPASGWCARHLGQELPWILLCGRATTPYGKGGGRVRTSWVHIEAGDIRRGVPAAKIPPGRGSGCVTNAMCHGSSTAQNPRSGAVRTSAGGVLPQRRAGLVSHVEGRADRQDRRATHRAGNLCPCSHAKDGPATMKDPAASPGAPPPRSASLFTWLSPPPGPPTEPARQPSA